MKPSFYTYFSSAVGTMMSVLLIVSFLQGHSVDIGNTGLFLVTIVSVVYAFYRRNTDASKLQPKENERDV